MVVESDHENLSEKKRFELETESEDSEAVDDTEFWDKEEEICYERFGVAEIKEISGDEVGTVTSALCFWGLRFLRTILFYGAGEGAIGCTNADLVSHQVLSCPKSSKSLKCVNYF